MSLINCPECESQLSSSAKMCPKCGFPIQEYIEERAFEITVKDLTDKIIKTEYKYPPPRQKVCIKCGAPFYMFSKAPFGEPSCNCSFLGREYPGYEVDFSNGGRLLNLGNELYIHNNCTIPMNIGDHESEAYIYYENKLQDSIRKSEHANRTRGESDWEVREIPPNPDDYEHPNMDVSIPYFELKNQNKNQPHCPICHSTNLKRISTVRKAAKISVFGLFGAGDLGKTWQCENCGSKF